MITVKNLKLPLKYTADDITTCVAKVLRIKNSDIKKASLRRISIDARKKSDVHYIAMADVIVDGNENKLIAKCNNAQIASEVEYTFNFRKEIGFRPVIIGSGPAGLFCGLMLARAGAKPIIIERGQPVEERAKAIDEFWQSAVLNTESNVQFGEGGAGTFSDGKLNTGTNDKRASFVLKEFVRHGAPESILISAKPHIGTDMLKGTIINIRKEIEALGGEYKFNTLFTDFITSSGKITGVKISSNGASEIIDTNAVVLATGHSARDTFEMLKANGIEMQQKAFSIGARIEHLRSDIDECQYGKARYLLGSADYKLSTHLDNGRGVYTFCMCPGGFVVNASSENGMLCTNGMSLYKRDNINSNSALLVGVNPSDYDCGDVLDGVRLQRRIERAAYKAIGGYLAPVQRVSDFLGSKCNTYGKVTPTILPGYEFTDISKLYPDYIANSMREGIVKLGQRMPVFSNGDAVLTAAETRSSSPVRIVRNENYQSPTLEGLYPCGEGAGYAGGIMSAATDGIKCAEAILK